MTLTLRFYDRSTPLWSIITTGLSCAVSKINGDFCRKSHISPNRFYLTHALRKFSLKFCNGGSSQKIRVILLPDGGNSWRALGLVLMQYQSVMDRQRDRQTDRRICRNNIALCMHRHADVRNDVLIIGPGAAHALIVRKLNPQVYSVQQLSLPNFIQIGRRMGEWRPKNLFWPIIENSHSYGLDGHAPMVSWICLFIHLLTYLLTYNISRAFRALLGARVGYLI